MNIHRIVARDLPDLWFQAVHDILDHGRRFTIDRGSYAGQTRRKYSHARPGWGSRRWAVYRESTAVFPEI